MADNISTRPVLPGEDTKIVSLREFEQRISELKDTFSKALTHEREIRETITKKIEEARRLNDKEILRRLMELNHAHELAAENWSRSMPREMFDQWQKEYDRWKNDVMSQLTALLPFAKQLEDIERRTTSIEASIIERRGLSITVSTLDGRVSTIESLVSKATGAAILLGLMGLSGVLALFLGLARLAGLLK